MSVPTRSFYVAYSYRPLSGGHSVGASDMYITGLFDAPKLNEMARVLAEKVGVDPMNLVITFFAELES